MVREYITADDCFTLQECGIRSFPSVCYPKIEMKRSFLDTVFDNIAASDTFRTQLRHLYAGATIAERHHLQFTYGHFNWMLDCLLQTTLDHDDFEHMVISQQLFFHSQIDERSPIAFKDIADMVGLLDPQLYQEVRRALRTP